MFELRLGDAKLVMQGLPRQSVDCCVTSPPYYRLRDYGVEGQIGMEDTLGYYLHRLTEVFTEMLRVMADHGTFWLVMGDTYSANRTYQVAQTKWKGSAPQVDGPSISTRAMGVPAKNLVGVPWKLALLLQDNGWVLRNDIIWEKPNAMPSSAKDRFTCSYEHVFLFTKKAKGYYFDPEPLKDDGPLARHPRDVWQINTAKYPGAHFAVMPVELARRCIMVGSPERVCLECGEPSRRLTKSTSINRYELPKDHSEYRPSRYDNGKAGSGVHAGSGQRFSRVETTGWSNCGCVPESIRPGMVIDPFMGTGVTLLAARDAGRDACGIELSPEYMTMTEKRLGLHTLHD